MQVQIVAEVLGLRPERIHLVAADTALTPVDLGSYSSRVTFMAGNACLNAARNMRDQIFRAVARKFGCSPAVLDARDDAVFSTDGAGIRLSFDDAVAIALDCEGALVAQGAYAPPEDARGGKFKGAGVGPSPSYSYSAQAAEVTVDPETGHVRVDRVVAAHDCGRALNPLAVKGQIEGSVYRAMGQALQEQMVWRDGRLMNPSFLEYRLPTTLETPAIESLIVESIDPEGPFGAKEAGEGSLAATIPAISNAIFDAVGVRLTDLPITPEKVLAALRAKLPAGKGSRQ
jgi:CO/xanthine dehydrogenase Mo-binding subunit